MCIRDRYHTIIDKLPNGEYELIIKNNAAYSIAGTTNKEEKIRFSKLSTREVSMLEIKFSNALKWDGIIKLNGKYFKRSYLVPVSYTHLSIILHEGIDINLLRVCRKKSSPSWSNLEISSFGGFQ